MLFSSVAQAVDLDNMQPGAGGEPLHVPKIYTIYNVSIDERAASSSIASRIALKKAQKQALEKLFRKIIREEDFARLPELSDRQVTELVSGIELSDEESSDVRYKADFTVHFSREKIYNFLSVLEIPFAETLSNPVNILTVFEKDGVVMLWENNNIWRKAWQDYDTVNNLVPVNIIEPSLANRLAITPWQAQRGDKKQLRQFARQLGLQKLYVISAKYDSGAGAGTRQGRLELTIHKSEDDMPAFQKIVTLENSSNDLSDDLSDNLAALYDKAIGEATYWIDNQWKKKVMIHFGSSSRLQVEIHFDQSSDWFEIKKRLEAISLIRKIRIIEFTLNKARVELEHSGEVGQIILTLDQDGLELKEQPGGEDDSLWHLSLKKPF